MQRNFRINAKGDFVISAGLRLYYVSKGSGTSVVLLHGNAGSIHDFSPVMRALAPGSYRSLAFDRPGHGQSERPAGDIATADVQAGLIRGALRKLKIAKPIIVGHSWGAVLVLAYALQYREELCGIVLLSPATYPEDERFNAQKTLIEIPGLGDLMIRMSSPFIDREIRRNLQRAFSPDEVPTEYLELARGLWNRPEQIRAIIQDEASFSPTTDLLRHRYSRVRVPTVIVTGDSDLLVNPELHAYPLHRAIPHSKLIVVPKTGHMLPQTRPKAVMEAIRGLHNDSNSC
jgi:pimeloyl-ACP methyl ester carboxylesterase